MKILLNIATHGDEKIGHKVAKEILKLKIDKNNLTLNVANKKAFKLHKRYIDQDLNRSFPGKKDGNYEERLAYKLLPLIKSVDLVIDIHSTSSQVTDTLIVTKLTRKTMEYIKDIKPKHVLIMNATRNNALISGAKVGMAFEYGKDNSQLALRKTVLGIVRLLNKLKLTHIKPPASRVKTDFYNVVSNVQKPYGYGLLETVKNYKLVKKDTAFAARGKERLFADNDFYPILFGERKYRDIFGFQATKISPDF